MGSMTTTATRTDKGLTVTLEDGTIVLVNGKAALRAVGVVVFKNYYGNFVGCVRGTLDALAREATTTLGVTQYEGRFGDGPVFVVLVAA